MRIRLLFVMAALAIAAGFGSDSILAQVSPKLDTDYASDWQVDCYRGQEIIKSGMGTGPSDPDPEMARNLAWVAAMTWADGKYGCVGDQPIEQIFEPVPVSTIVGSPQETHALPVNSGWLVEYTIRTRNGRTRPFRFSGATYCETRQKAHAFICEYLTKPPFCGAWICGVCVVQRPVCHCCQPRCR